MLSVRQIMLICSTIQYWSGNLKEEEKILLKNWMLDNLDEIPIRSLAPRLQIGMILEVAA